MPADWSQQLCERFHLRLPPDVTAWFDDELWRRSDLWLPLGDPIAPEDLLDPASHCVWGGQHLPDTLPLFNDGTGNVTCVRIAGDGTVRECVVWYMEGAWCSLGETLAETILYRLAREAVKVAEGPSAPRRAARPWWRFWGGAPAPAEPVEPHFLLDWARQWVPASREIGAFGEAVAAGNAEMAAQSLSEAELAELPLRRDRCEALCTPPLRAHLRTRGGEGLAARGLGVGWQEFTSWLADTDRIPIDARRKLAATLSEPEEVLFRQDWEGAAREAEEVLDLRRDLAWPFAVLGYALERRGDLPAAADLYRLGAETLGTTQDFTESWLLSEPFRPVKFAVQRLARLRDRIEPSWLDRPYLQAALHQPSRVDDYWLERGDRALAGDRPDEAYRCYYAAGWDEFSTCDGDRLDRLARAADAAGFAALRELARHHRATTA